MNRINLYTIGRANSQYLYKGLKNHAVKAGQTLVRKNQYDGPYLINDDDAPDEQARKLKLIDHNTFYKFDARISHVYAELVKIFPDETLWIINTRNNFVDFCMSYCVAKQTNEWHQYEKTDFYDNLRVTISENEFNYALNRWSKNHEISSWIIANQRHLILDYYSVSEWGGQLAPFGINIESDEGLPIHLEKNYMDIVQNYDQFINWATNNGLA